MATTVVALEDRMILADATEVARIASTMAKSADLGGVLGLALMPLTCFFAVEAYDCLQRRHVTAAHPFLEAEASRIRDARARLKLLDADGFAGARRRLEEITEASFRVFNEGHSGILGPLKRWLQDDLGLYFVGEDLLCTTHVSIMNLGYDAARWQALTQAKPSAVGAEVRSFAESMGQFLTDVCEQVGGAVQLGALNPVSLVVRAEDHKSRVAYAGIAERLGLADASGAAVFTWLVSQVNYVHRGLRTVANAESGFFLRVRFLTAFHLLQALRVLGAALRGDRREGLGAIVSALQSRPSARKIRRWSRLRNVLAHYDAEPIGREKGDPLDVITRHLAGLGRSELSDLVDAELESASLAFRAVVSPGVLGRGQVSLAD